MKRITRLHTLIVMGVSATILCGFLMALTFSASRASSLFPEAYFIMAGFLMAFLILWFAKPPLWISVVLSIALPYCVFYYEVEIARVLPLGAVSSAALAKKVDIGNCTSRPIQTEGNTILEVTCSFTFPEQQGILLADQPDIVVKAEELENQEHLQFQPLDTRYDPELVGTTFKGGPQKIIRTFRLATVRGTLPPRQLEKLLAAPIPVFAEIHHNGGYHGLPIPPFTARQSPEIRTQK